jgi:predicted O-methyltransferase YrrM
MNKEKKTTANNGINLIDNMLKMFKKNVKQIATKAWNYTQGRKKISQLRNIKIDAADSMADAISETFNNNISIDEKILIDKIENVRSALINSSNKIVVVDYGAGKPNSNRSEKEMYQGVTSTIMLSDIVRSSQPYFWSLLLFKLVRKFKPSTCIELGSCVGISVAYQASALKLNNKGHIITIEGAESLATLTEKNLQQLNLNNVHVVYGRFQDKLETVLNENKPIDYAFIDGYHDGKATIYYFEQFSPYLSEEAIIVFDDINWSRGMRKAWDYIKKNEIVKITLELKKTMGICLISKNLNKKYEI